MKLLVWIGLIALVVAALRAQIRNAVQPRPGQPQKEPMQQEPVAEPMVSCAHCGVHFPVSEAVPGEGVMFCSDEHRRLYLRS